MQNPEPVIIAAMVSAMVGLLFFFVKSYFTNIEKTLAKLEVSIDLMRKDLHETTKQMILAQSELKALWRFADKTHSRASDLREVGHDGNNS